MSLLLIAIIPMLATATDLGNSHPDTPEETPTLSLKDVVKKTKLKHSTSTFLASMDDDDDDGGSSSGRATCKNVTSAGSIGINLNQGCSPFNPPVIYSISKARGGESGIGSSDDDDDDGVNTLWTFDDDDDGNYGSYTSDIQYRWRYSVNGCHGPFYVIQGARSSKYNPGTLTRTTWFVREARRVCSGNFSSGGDDDDDDGNGVWAYSDDDDDDDGGSGGLGGGSVKTNSWIRSNCLVIYVDQNCVENCNNGKDDDGDGKVDCDDPDCYNSNVCKPTCSDYDNDGVCDNVDNCRYTYNPGQYDNDGDGIGNACDNTPDGHGGGGGGGQSNCSNVKVSVSNGKITVSGFGGAKATVQYLGQSTGWGTLTVCDGNCSDPVSFNVSGGDYTVKIQLSGAYNSYCFIEKSIHVGGGGGGGGGGNPCDYSGGDSDYDGVCDNVDNCRYKANPDQADNDGDGIGNVCDNTPNGNGGGGGGGGHANCDNVKVNAGNGKITVSGFGGAKATVEYLGQGTGWATLKVCEGNCSDPVSFNVSGGDYKVKIQLSGANNSYCYTERSVHVGGGGGGGGGGGNSCDYQGGDSDYDGVCDNVDNCRYQANPDQADNDGDGIGNVCDDTPNGNGGGGGGNASCDHVTASFVNHKLTIKGLGAPIIILKVFDDDWTTVFECNGDKCPETVVFNTDPNEEICHIDVQFYSADWKLICTKQITVRLNGSASSRSAAQLNFTAFRQDRKVDLQWLTNTGWRNDHFELERSIDGINFKTLRSVANTDETDDLEYYENEDLQPVLGTNYYRLKQVYKDGTFEYTDIQQVDFSINLDAFSMYPNPAKDELFLNLKEYIGKSATIRLVNNFGQILETRKLDRIDQATFSLPLKKAPSGFYSVTIQIDGYKIINRKLIIDRLH